LKTENQIKKKEEMGDDLKFIDFHQLQIENKKYVKEIDDKNGKLMDLKISTGKIVTKLTTEKKRLNSEVELGKERMRINTEKISNIEKYEIEKEKVNSEKKKLEREKKNI